MNQLVAWLAPTRLGAEILQTPRQGHADLIGRAAHAANFLVVAHVLTQKPYAALLGKATRVTRVVGAVAPGQFGFTVYSDSAAERQKTFNLPSRLAAYEALYDDVLLTLQPVLNITASGTRPAHFSTVVQNAGPISVALFSSALRHRIPWAPGDPDDRVAYMWWFITVEPHQHAAATQLVQNVASLAARFIYTRGLMIAETRQQRTHYHGILWCAVAVTPTFIRTRLAQAAQLIKLEPLRMGSAAAYNYIVNQQMAGVWYWPQPAVVHRLSTSQCTFQAMLARPGPQSARQWYVAFDTAVREGTPWYTMKAVSVAMPNARVRAGLRLKSRTAAVAVTRTWPLAAPTYTRTQWPAIAQAYVRMYGYGAFRFWSHDIRRWAGQPVIITDTDADHAAAQHYLSQRTWPITHVILIGPDP
jgi:hypothetical protein